MNLNCYDFKLIDLKSRFLLNILLQKIVSISTKQFYCISMFPYSSGFLHFGHVRLYIINDVICRYMVLKNYKSFMFFGWDSFGLPTENASISYGVSPLYWTRYSIASMRKQLKFFNLSIYWLSELNTSCSFFCRFTQLLFYFLFFKKIIFIGKSWVNWDSVDKTVLANEQVLNGKGWRSGSVIVKKYVSTLFLRTSNLTHILYKTTKCLDWDSNVLKRQLNWLSYNKSFCINFIIFGNLYEFYLKYLLHVFFLDYILIPINSKFLMKFNSAINIKFSTYSTKFNINKRIVFTGVYASFFVFKKIYLPVYLFDSLVFIVKKIFFNLYFINENVVTFLYNFSTLNCIVLNFSFSFLVITLRYSFILLFSFIYNIVFSVLDWALTRQRYWGTPVPLSICKCGNISLISRAKFPLRFNLSKLNPSNLIYNDFCIFCGNIKFYFSDTLDTFFDSTWYFLLYLTQYPFFNKNLPMVDLYLGGKEHSILHLLYVRIVFLYLYLYKVIPYYVPFKKVICIGLVLIRIFYIKSFLPFLPFLRFKKYVFNRHILCFRLLKMSKSFSNSIDPVFLVIKYGSDCVRLYILFSTSIYSDFEWNVVKITGCFRFLNQIWIYFTLFNLNNPFKNMFYIFKFDYIFIEELKYLINISYKKLFFNKVISLLMVLFSKLKNFNNFIFSVYTKFYLIKNFMYFLVYFFPLCPNLVILLFHILPFGSDFSFKI